MDEMKLMLTSFGIEHSDSQLLEDSSVFYRMPPVSFGRINEKFIPDYELLLLCDKLLMDEQSFEKLIANPADVYSRIAETLYEFKTEGRIELFDFQSILRANKNLLQRMLDHDLKILDHWVVPLRDSLNIWRDFSKKSIKLIKAKHEHWGPGIHQRAVEIHEMTHSIRELKDELDTIVHLAARDSASISMMVNSALTSSTKRKRKEYRAAMRKVLSSYLTYVNSNLIIANELNVGFHDWLDFTPFYSLKFLGVGREKNEIDEQRNQIEKLFTIPFPNLAIRSTSSLMKALNDKRIIELRQLIKDAASGTIEFDDAFAKSVLSDVLHAEQKTTYWRNIIGYITLPIGFVPLLGTPAQKVIEEAVGTPLEKKLKKDHRWFYMLSKIAEAGYDDTADG